MKDWLKPIPCQVPEECFFGCGPIKNLVCPIDQIRDDVFQFDMLIASSVRKEAYIEALEATLSINYQRIKQLEEYLVAKDQVITETRAQKRIAAMAFKARIRGQEEDIMELEMLSDKQREVIIELEIAWEKARVCIKSQQALIEEHEKLEAMLRLVS